MGHKFADCNIVNMSKKKGFLSLLIVAHTACNDPGLPPVSQF